MPQAAEGMHLHVPSTIAWRKGQTNLENAICSFLKFTCEVKKRKYYTLVNMLVATNLRFLG